MKQQFKVLVNGTCFEVEIEDLNQSPLQVSVNGKTYSVDVEGTGTTVHPAAPVQPAAAVPVPAAAPAIMPAPVQPPPAAASGNDVRAPMPGIIHDVMVKPGDRVTPGQQLCTLEAMKMKSAVRTSREGVIASVEVASGQKVAHGDVLVRFA